MRALVERTSSAKLEDKSGIDYISTVTRLPWLDLKIPEMAGINMGAGAKEFSFRILCCVRIIWDERRVSHRIGDKTECKFISWEQRTSRNQKKTHRS